MSDKKSMRWVGMTLFALLAFSRRTIAAPPSPTANDQSVTTTVNTPITITLTATAPGNQSLTFSIVAGPTHGVLSSTTTLPMIIYTPTSNNVGMDSFTFQVKDNSGTSNVGTVSISVSTPAAPSANPQSVTTAFNTAKAITLTGTDPNNLPLTYAVATNPSHGALSGAGATQTYTPTPNYSGADSFTFKVNNGFVDSSTATISITVSAPSPPTASSQAVTTAFQTSKIITLQGSDPNIPPLTLTYLIVASPSHGTLSGSGATQTYTPTSNYSGADSFTFKVNNGFSDSNTATVSIMVSLPGVPTANSQSVTTAFNTAKTILLTGTDPNNLPLTYSIGGTPAHGTLSGTVPNITYTPATGYTGADSFTFMVNNGSVNSSAATVNITISAPGVPTANSQSLTIPFDTAQPITLTGTDPNNLPLTYSIVGTPAHGTLSGTAPHVTYAPTTGYSGSDSFTFQVNNGVVNSSVGTINLTIQSSGITGQVPTPIIDISGPLTLNDVISITPGPGSPPITSYNWAFTPVNTSGTGSSAGLVSQTTNAPRLSLGSLGLHIGIYQVDVQAVAGQAVSSNAVATLTIVATNATSVRVYPNPWRSDQDSSVMITFNQLNPGSTVKIFDMAARWVRSLGAPTNSVSWDRRNDSGDLVASGMYIYLITDAQGNQSRGKLTIIK